ncbi:unnamed protein product [Adineta steineri]|uniref:EF-hand domain-containing protein n=1 Tax=Adineta steineri TaxID=433720 RepID=A0A814RC10_9BILA|nr:unnamed protein product [Adineta steineri]CAF1130210.1 unnamed protein product [Adineta steineri]CAF3935998.1 unnamed protein product [Adineta steineri]
MNSVDAAFNQADVNHDGGLNQAEFREFLARNSIGGASTSNYSVNNEFNNLEGTDGYGSLGFRSSSYEGTDLGYAGAGYGASSYESSAFRSSVGTIGGDVTNLNVVGAAGVSNADAAAARFSTATRTSTIQQQYETDAQGNFKDSNPQIIRRPAPSGPVTYTQNIKVRFLQPPAVPPPGPLIIKEVRPPQPPPPAPLRVRQQAPPLPQAPPLILREKPPPVPAVVAAQTVVRNLAAIAVPPRSVVIERLPAAPPKPRDIVIERWIPYGPQAERKTIVQRAAAAVAYARPHNVIIQYEAPQVRVIRQFQRLGVTQENPQEYINRYGATLFDSQTLVQQARAAGVVEDISPPAISNAVSSNISEFSSSSSTGAFNLEGNTNGAIDVVSNISGGGANGAANRASFYESTSYSSGGGGDISGLGYGGIGSLSYDSSSYGSSNGGVADALFSAVDTNNDGVISRSEFRNAGL